MKKYMTALWAALTTALCGLRIYQLLALTEPETGFLRVFDLSGYVFYILLALGALGLFLLSRVLMKKDGIPAVSGGSRETGFALLALGTAILLESLQAMLFPSDASADFSPVLWTAEELLGVLTAAYLVYRAVGLLTGREGRVPALLTLLPALWLAFRALLIYLDARVAVTVPAIVLSILTSVFLAVWWMALARVQADIDAPKGLRSLAALSPICLMLIVVSVLPAAIASFAAEAGVSPVSLRDVATALFAPYVFLTNFSLGGKSGEAEA